MAYCPRCRYEYRAGVLVCPDCNEALVDQLPAEKTAAMVPDESWTIVGGVASEMSSEIAKGSLDSSNIPSVIIASTFGAFGKGMDLHSQLAPTKGAGNIIMVPKEYREEAALILMAVLGDDLIQPEG